MVAMLVAMSVMAVMLTALLPVWTTFMRREKEAEYVFRAEQYARAIALFQRKYGNANPPNLDVLVKEKFLRKKYKDPLTGDDFQVVTAGSPIPGQDPPPRGGGAGPTRGGGGGIIGVVSKSTEQSLRLYNGRDKYNEWVVLGTQQSNRAGGPPGSTQPGGPGGGPPGFPRGGGAGGRGGFGGPGGTAAGGDASITGFPRSGGPVPGRLSLPPAGGRGPAPARGRGRGPFPQQ